MAVIHNINPFISCHEIYDDLLICLYRVCAFLICASIFRPFIDPSRPL